MHRVDQTGRGRAILASPNYDLRPTPSQSGGAAAGGNNMLGTICVLAVLTLPFMFVQWNGKVWNLDLLSETSQRVLPKETFMSNVLIRLNGEGWKVNPGSKSDVATHQGYECKWIDFESTTGKSAKFCGHPFDDIVIRKIEQQKRFNHCNVLPQMWQNAGPKQKQSVYLEIGANVGSCVMEMLLSTDANIVAFEPHPRNQFALQKSVEALPEAYQSRFASFRRVLRLFFTWASNPTGILMGSSALVAAEAPEEAAATTWSPLRGGWSPATPVVMSWTL